MRALVVAAAIACSSCGGGGGPAARAGCTPVTLERPDSIVVRAIAGLARMTAADGWSEACAEVRSADGREVPTIVTVEIGWQGTLHEFAALPGATRVLGLGDEAYLLDAGRRIALRSGELVAVVAASDTTAGSPVSLENFGRRVAALMRHCNSGTC